MIRATKAPLLFGYAFVIALITYNLNNCFFWDTVQLGSLHGNYFFKTGFSRILLPDYLDSGHIPAFGMYIALAWKFFGRSMITSHLAMLPFAIGIVYQLHLLCRRFINQKYAGFALLLILADPSLLSQMTLVSPDVPLAFFFLMALNAVFENRKWLIGSCIFLLFLTSMRGMMVSFCLLLLDLYCNVNFRTKAKHAIAQTAKRSFIYLPALFIFIAYNFYHFKQKRWIGYHKDSPWADCFAPVDFKGFLFNVGIYGWRLIDFGRIGVWIVFTILIFSYTKKILCEKHTKTVLLFTVCLMVLLPANMLWAKNLLAHRYLIPIYLSFSLLCAVILFSSYVAKNLRYILSALWFVILISGNFWIYPPKISKGWDATLAHLPYYKLRDQANSWIENQHIDFKNIETFFPNDGIIDNLTLNNDKREMTVFNGSKDYVYYSNIYNIEDQILDSLVQHYTSLKHFENHGVYITIYQKKAANPAN